MGFLGFIIVISVLIAIGAAAGADRVRGPERDFVALVGVVAVAVAFASVMLYAALVSIQNLQA